MAAPAPTPPPLSPPGVSPKTVERAINALLKWRAANSTTQKPQLLDHDEFIYLILTLKKIPQRDSSRTNPFKIPLPHPLIAPPKDNTDLCLIIDDRPKSSLTKEAAKKKIQNDNVAISKIVKFSKLKTDYRPFEAKRKLCDSYDMFFADRRVIPLMPRLLGKQFFKKKKIPIAVDLKHKNWKEQIERACGSALLFLRSGTCSVVRVGRVSLGRDQIVENVVAAINGIAEIVPRNWLGIRSFHLKLRESLSLPIYQVVPDLKLKIEGVKEKGDEEFEKEDKVGTRLKKKKGRIQEVRYMDNNADVGEILDALGSDGQGDIDDNHDYTQMASGESVGKKRKKGDKGKVESNEKKVSKVKIEDGIKSTKGDSVNPKKKKKDSLTLNGREMKVKDKRKKKFSAERLGFAG